MKKKGLIIATIVMVLVLAVSLTTATYAWFTANAQASVTSIGVAVTTDAKVMIGVSNTNAFTTSTAIESMFQYGAVTYTATAANKWSDGQPGLGTAIDTGLQLTTLSKACFPSATGTGDTPGDYGVAGTSTTYTTAFTSTMDRQWLKSAGNGATLGESNQFEFAYANNHAGNPGDYLDVTFGVRAAKANITQIGIVLGFQSQNSVNLGMAAGFNYWYQVKGGQASGLQEFYTQHYDATIASMSAPTNDWTTGAWVAADGLSWTPAAGDATHVITVAGTGASVLSQTDIYEIRVIIFLNGWDSDCNNSAASAGIAEGSNIRIDFITKEQAAQQNP